MKQGLLLIYLLVFLLSISSVYALDVYLISPSSSPYTTSEGETINFKCRIDKSSNAKNVTLQLTGEGTLTFVNTSLKEEELGLLFASFSKKIVKGTWSWTCYADSDIQTFTSNPASKTIIVSEANSAPTFSGTIPNQAWTSSQIKTNAFDLDDYFSDPDSDPLTFNYTISTSSISVTVASDHRVTFIQDSGWTGTATIKFYACDDNIACSLPSNQITLTVSQASCTESWSCTSWSSCSSGTQTRTCTDSNNCGTTTNKPAESQSCSTCEEDWECTDWSSCSDGTQTRTCTDNNDCGTTEDRPSTSKSCSVPDSELYSLEITSSTPSSSTVTINKGASKTFMIDTNLITAEIEWYVDDKLQTETSDAFKYASTASGTHTIKVIVKKGTDVDAKEWEVTVVEPVPIAVVSTNKCGNNQTDVNETCLSCPQDIPCKENEVCEEGACKEKQSSFIDSVTGYATKIKDSLIDMWYYSLAVLALVILVIFILAYQKFKSKKSKPLAEFEEKKPLLSRIRKSLRDWDKNRQQKKENKVQVKQLEKERKQEIKESAPTDLNPIISFINESKTRGYSNWQIVRALKNKGWSRIHIRQAFTQLNDSGKEAKGN